MIGNLTHIMRLLIALCAAYLAQHCPIFGEKTQTFLWVFALTMFTVSMLCILLSILEYWGIIP